MEVFLFAVNAIVPILLLILLGYLLRRTGLLSEAFFREGNRLVFRVALPILIYTNVYDVAGLGEIRWDAVLYGLGAVLLIFALGLAAVLLFVPQKSARGVLLQCIFRSNFAIIGLPLAGALGGSEGTRITSLMLAFTIPLFNVLAVISLSVFGEEGAPRKSAGEILKSIITNPLILAAAAGLVTLGIRAVLPVGTDGEPVFTIRRNLPFLYTALQDVGKATAFLSLVVLGGLLDFSTVRGKTGYLFMGTLGRVILAPAVGLAGAILLSSAGILPLSPGDWACYIALFGSPVAFSSAIMAAEMGGDADLARQLVVWTSVCPVVTLFAIVMLFRSAGYL